jgi:hypothetical protein
LKNKNSVNKKPTLNLNINEDDSELNDFIYCWEVFSSRPNKILIHSSYSSKLFEEVISRYKTQSTNFIEVLNDGESEIIVNMKSFISIEDSKIYCSYIVIDKNSENSMVNELTFFYASEEEAEKVQGLIEELNDCLLNFCDEDINNLNVISFTQNGLEVEPIESELDLDNFELFYSKKTFKDINKLVKDMKKSNKGLSILYGDRGLGKTSVINYIASKLDRIVIFIPNNMIDHTINNPEFRKFLKRYDRPVIIIDDCEMVLGEIFTKSNISSNNLLQMVDGFLSDNLQVSVVTIFNVENEDEIDHTLLDCNNLLKVIDFDELSINESNELSEHLGHNKKYKNKSRVLDIIRNNKTKDIFEIGL